MIVTYLITPKTSTKVSGDCYMVTSPDMPFTAKRLNEVPITSMDLVSKNLAPADPPAGQRG